MYFGLGLSRPLGVLLRCVQGHSLKRSSPDGKLSSPCYHMSIFALLSRRIGHKQEFSPPLALPTAGSSLRLLLTTTVIWYYFTQFFLAIEWMCRGRG